MQININRVIYVRQKKWTIQHNFFVTMLNVDWIMAHGFRPIECRKWHIWYYENIPKLIAMHWMSERFPFFLSSILSFVLVYPNMDEMSIGIWNFCLCLCQCDNKKWLHKTRYLNGIPMQREQIHSPFCVCVLDGIPWHAELFF